MARRGRKRRLIVEDEYWALLASGVGTVEACRRLGIGKKTGYRWRAERGGVPPVIVVEADRSGRYLSLLERQQIAVFNERGLSLRDIGRSGSFIPTTHTRRLAAR